MNNFETVIKQNHPIIYKICRVYSTEEDFDDLYQEILVNIWKGLKRFEGNSQLSTWLYRVALNTALTYQRNKKKRTVEQRTLHQMPVLVLDDGDYEEKEEKINQLYHAIRQLKKEDRSIVLLYLEEKKYEEIAEIVGISPSNVGVKLNRIKKRLFKILNASQYGE